ncbi:Membrane magnesium transporter [Choanephora cucurbitarum]|uniref:Membrane magnesium transporter n=1 Tax=Choanephora cucurbitarum TaxID=101091 RepID=A0A1C7NDL4_9FUNG|nr:Membrane magnesium transporter [Choanephora cucurbitarum]
MSISQQSGKWLGILGALFLAHSAYSTYEHLAYIKAVDEVDAELPIEITVECLVSALVALFGVILSADAFKPIGIETEVAKMTIDKVDTRPSFITFNHRQIHSTQAQQSRSIK